MRLGTAVMPTGAASARLLGELTAMFLLASCGDKVDKPPSASAATTGGKAPAEAVSAVVASRDKPEPPADQLSAEKPSLVPGLDHRKFIGPLEDAYRRMDPIKDGWETEAFNSAAMEQLHVLEALLTGSEAVTSDSLGRLVAPRVAATSLRPVETSKVFDDGQMRVLRASRFGQPVGGIGNLADGLNALKQIAPRIDPHFKIFRVTRENEAEVVSSVIVDIGASSGEERRQINGVWNCRWQTAPGSSPLLTEIVVAQHEEIVRSEGTPLFGDATTAVLGANSSYRDQLLVPTDHWRSRIPRDLGLDPVANHGIAIGDVNGDDLDDVYLCQQGGLPNRLFLQNPDGTLRDISAFSGADWLDYCAAALFIDFDNDGDRDLVISQDFRVIVMSNDGAGRFTQVFASGTKAQSFSLAAADYDNDGLVDFYVCGYNPSTASLRGGAMGEPVPFHDANNGGRNMLWKNQGGFKFTDVTAATGLEQNNTRFSFAAAWEDFDNDGDQDLYVANDYGRNCFYRNDHGTFTDIAAQVGVEDTSSGMSVSWSDFNQDGLMDLYTSNMFSSAGNRITYQTQFKSDLPEDVRAQFQHIARGNTLFQGAPGGAFKDVSLQAGVTLGRWAWCSKFVDINNDGLDDILVANGFITAADPGDL